MQPTDQFRVEESAGVRTLLLARPERSNALNADLVESLLQETRAAIDARVRMIVFKGLGKNFCAGFDTSEIETQSDGEVLTRFVRIEMLLQTVRRSPCMTVAWAQGAAFGAGADLLAACHLRLGAPDLRMRFPGFRFGVALGTRHLTRQVGSELARRLLIENLEIDAANAKASGLINDIVNDGDVYKHVAERVRFANELGPQSVERILRLTEAAEDDDADLADLVRSIADPGLAARIANYRDSSRSATRAK